MVQQEVCTFSVVKAAHTTCILNLYAGLNKHYNVSDVGWPFYLQTNCQQPWLAHIQFVD